MNKKPKQQKPIITPSPPPTPKFDAAGEAKAKGYYFDNHKVEQLLTVYVKGGCVDVKLRDEIMSHAMELLRQIIRTHNFNNIYPGHDPASFGDLFQVGWCVNPNTYLFTDRGMEQIGDICGVDDAGLLSRLVFGREGLQTATSYVKFKNVNTLKFQTKLGYNVEATADHPFLILRDEGTEWIKAGELKIGDLVGVQYNQQCFGSDDAINFQPSTTGGSTNMWNVPDTFSSELAYLIGLYIAEGSSSKHRVTIYNSEPEILDILKNNNLGLNIKYVYKNGGRSRINSIRFVEFLNHLGLHSTIHADQKFIPFSLLKCTKPIVSALLRGMFDGDGHVNRYNGCVGYTSVSKTLIYQLQTILLNFGYVARIFRSDRRTTNFNKNGKIHTSNVLPSYQLLLSTTDSKKFFEDIGFNTAYRTDKSSNLSSKPFVVLPPQCINHIKALWADSKLSNYHFKTNYNLELRLITKKKTITKSTLSKILEAFSTMSTNIHYQYLQNLMGNICWLPIVQIGQSQSDVVDISVPTSRSFTGNGIILSNCQIERTLYKFDWRPGHTKVFNFWSQVAKTVILAHIKREMRDKKNYGSYKNHQISHHKPGSAVFERFVNEIKAMAQYDDGGLHIVDALEKLYQKDEKPHDGLIGKLVKLSGLSRQRVVSFLKQVRLRSFEFTDSPLNQERSQLSRGTRHDSDAEDDDEQ